MWGEDEDKFWNLFKFIVDDDLIPADVLLGNNELCLNRVRAIIEEGNWYIESKERNVLTKATDLSEKYIEADAERYVNAAPCINDLTCPVADGLK